MSKQVFWPLTLVVMGLIFVASNLGMLPIQFWNLWPLILIVVGLGGLLTADRTAWVEPSSKRHAPSKKTASANRRQKR